MAQFIVAPMPEMLVRHPFAIDSLLVPWSLM
jgi:hypothetical protein